MSLCFRVFIGRPLILPSAVEATSSVAPLPGLAAGFMAEKYRSKLLKLQEPAFLFNLHLCVSLSSAFLEMNRNTREKSSKHPGQCHREETYHITFVHYNPHTSTHKNSLNNVFSHGLCICFDFFDLV